MQRYDISFEEIKGFFKGAVEIKAENGRICAERFTAAQRRAYDHNPDFLMKSHSSAGVMLEVLTDAAALELEYCISSGSSRTWYDFDVKINGILKQHESCDDFNLNPSGVLNIPLDGSSNRVTVFFPPLARVEVVRFSRIGGSFISPVERKKRLLSFGDSITQGYDARFPSVAYPVQVAEAFDAELFNKAIGGEFFNPDLLLEADPFVPDMITVAYGTNDWSKHQRQEFEAAATGFFRRLHELYPETPVWVIVPLWRKDCDRITGVGTFASAREFIVQRAKEYSNVTIVDGFQLLPQITEIFSDGYLHPNDFGFQFMAQKLIAAMR